MGNAELATNDEGTAHKNHKKIIIEAKEFNIINNNETIVKVPNIILHIRRAAAKMSCKSFASAVKCSLSFRNLMGRKLISPLTQNIYSSF